ncbi:serine/threonine-protein kinase Smg1 [Anopheles nili]|uniref:serine/threonine-protein kinase Smg1 n=1 Tax=Anopheles nili TaxID=185578 RepID=UPI00237C22D7|nr:serine/threonine-protein kinase Smg1 [Anopheles nili]
MGGKGYAKSAQQCAAKKQPRRGKKKPTEQQRQPKANADDETDHVPSDQQDSWFMGSDCPTAIGGKRYQSTRAQAAAQRRDKARKLASTPEAGRAGSDERATPPHELANLPEDMRISQLLRRLTGESNVRVFLNVCNRLEVVLLDPANASYVRKSFEILATTVTSVLDGGLRECHDRVAELFGMMLHVLVCGSPDASALQGWTSRYLNQKRIRRSSLIALRHAIVLDRTGRQLEPVADWLVGLLQQILEKTDNLDVFVLVTEIMVEQSDAYAEAFSSHFSDIVDIVVGWQLETTQPTEVKLHCARVLLAFQMHWYDQRSVTFNLLEQFSEDIDRLCKDFDYCDDYQQRLDANRYLGSLLTAFNSVLKCMHNPNVSTEDTTDTMLVSDNLGRLVFITDEMERFDRCGATITAIVLQLLEVPPYGLAISAICEFIMLKLLLSSPPMTPLTEDEILRLIGQLVRYSESYSDAQFGALLHLLLHLIGIDRPELQQHRALALLPLLFDTGPFFEARFRQSQSVRQALLLLYHRILTLKSVDVLQTAYRKVLTDMEDALGRLRAAGPRGTLPGFRRLQYRIQFNLLILSPLAMARNSIFITWTLKDQPVLHVLLERLASDDGKLWGQRIHAHLRYAVLLTAYSHCCANNHFVSSSALLQPKSYTMVDRFRRLAISEENQPTVPSEQPESPTADHFGLEVRFLGTILGHWIEPGRVFRYEPSRDQRVLLLLLDWCHAIVTQTAQYHDVLRDCDDFNRLLVNVCSVAVETGSESESVGLRCADCLDVACQYPTLNPVSYQAIAEACCVHLCSVYDALRTRYTVLLSKLPLRHSLRQVNEFTGLNRHRWEQIGELKNGLYQGGGGAAATFTVQQSSATLRMADLRALLNRIAFGREEGAYAGGYLHELLTRSFNRPSRYGEMALRDLRCLIPWAQWEAAQLCVTHKLRTPFGKPQSTFLRIESIVKQCARILALNDRFPVRDIRTSIANQRHARILLGFLEALEKSIYNAAEGTAYALPVLDKPARTFFRVNQSTCAEWFTRIRTAVDLVALHCMEPEMAIRYSEAVLRELVAAGKTNDLIFEHMLMSLVWALLRNWESDALYGVYVWSKRLTGRKYTWIRMAAEEAAGHRETAADGFRSILADTTTEGKMDRHIREFIVDQTVLSLLFTGDYLQLHEFLLAEEASDTPRATIPLITVTAAQISSILRYEETRDVSVIDIAQWELLDVGNNIPNDFSCHKMICAVENSISGIILLEQIEQRERLIDASTELVQCYLQECLLTRCREYLFQLTITNHILYKIAQRVRVSDGATVSGAGVGSLNVEKFYGTLTLIRLLAWSEFLLADTGASGYDGEQQNIDLRLDLVSIGRKEKNYALCRRELEKYYHKSQLATRLSRDHAELAGQQRLSLEQVATALMRDHPPDGALWDENLSRAVYEHCKWLYCQPGKRLEAINFAACATSTIDGVLLRQQDQAHDMELTPSWNRTTGKLTERAARFMLTIADWLTGMGEIGEQPATELSSVRRLEGLLPAINVKPVGKAHTGILGPCDRLIGTLLQGSVNRSPDLAKAWFALGSWLYRWGRRIVENSASGDGSSARISVDQVAAILTEPGVSLADCERIVAILNEHEPGRIVPEPDAQDTRHVDDDEEELDLDSSATIGSIGLLDALHRAVPGLEGVVAPERLHAIIDIWRNNHRAVYGYYESAAAAYFRFLQLSSGRSTDTSTTPTDGVDSERARSVTVTLRLLRLIVKHALGLKEVLEEGLESTPSEPWRVITPQLFARLAHHEPYVRRRVSELLCRVAKDAPHLIIFPAVVGSVQEEPGQLTVVDVIRDGVDEVSNRLDEGEQPAGGDTSGLGFCFNALLDILSREIPDTVKQVQTLVHELRRISLLWEELWVVSLQQIYADYTKRIPAFEAEYRRLHASGQMNEARRALLAEKRRLLLRPLLFVLEQLHSITSRPAETNHERHFQERYHRFIRNMLTKLREQADCNRPIDGWSRFKTFYTQLQQRSQKRFSFFLRLSDVSPNLLRLAHTAIAMPGIDTTHTGQAPVLIRSVDNNIQILPTKTRPKKLTFCGNNGRRFGYLSKGLEDLHLDERIMQFLSIANLMMTKSIDCNGNVTHYRAEHYSVIPLGPRSGLITWVDNTVPIFSLYKKWLQREASQNKESKGAIRPSELFYNKLTPLLHSHGIKANASRREWPLEVLKQVLAELQQETPRDLLTKELWCHSATTSSWRHVTRSYSLSLAVMSVIGYIIGLGDRHLDNMLVKLATGEIVHIDYNVCFEKGKTLRVPEKVPFRMTPNLEEALGVTGIEGTFRLACEHVLKSLKKGRETLLTLLEAFVYDPLVDWAIGEEIGSGLPMTATDITVSTAAAASNAPGSVATRYISLAKKQLDREVTRDTLAVRFAECRADWFQNRDELLHHLLCMQKLLRDIRDVREDLRESDRLRSSLSQQLQLIGEAEYLDTAFGSHPLASLANRLTLRAQLLDECANQRDQLGREADRLLQQLAHYNDCRRLAQQDRFAGLQKELTEGLTLIGQHPDEQTFRSLLELFTNLEPGYLQYVCAHKKLNALHRQAVPMAQRVLELLVHYFADRRHQQEEHEHPLQRYSDWYRRLADGDEQDLSTSLAAAQQVIQEQQELVEQGRRHVNLPRDVPDTPAGKIEQLVRELIELERTAVTCEVSPAIPVNRLAAVVRQLAEACTINLSEDGERALANILRVASDYAAVEQFQEVTLALIGGGLDEDTPHRSIGEQEILLNNQFERLMVSVEQSVLEAAADDVWDDALHDTLKTADAMTRVLIDSWMEDGARKLHPDRLETAFKQLLTSTSPWSNQEGTLTSSPFEKQAAFLTVWLGPYPDTVAAIIDELVEALIVAGKLQALAELRQAYDSDPASLRCFIRRFIRLRLVGRVPLAVATILRELANASLSADEEPPPIECQRQQLCETIHLLESLQPRLQAMYDVASTRAESLRNRLSWSAAVHPPLCTIELTDTYEHGSMQHTAASQRLTRAFNLVLRHAKATLRYEQTRPASDATLPSEFETLLECWQKMLASCSQRGASFVSPTEEALVELLDPEGSIDQTWISNVRALIDDMTDQLLTKIARLEQDDEALQAALHAATRRLLALTRAHDDIAGDIRSLLRTQLRIDGSAMLREYLHRYRRFLDLLLDSYRALKEGAGKISTETTVDVSEKVDELLDLLHDVFEQLFQFEELPTDGAGDGEEPPVDEHIDTGGTDGSPSSIPLGSDVPGAEGKEQKQREQKEQKRNAYAVSVWRRIRMKLEGRDPDPARRCSVAEQVAYMIDEAMDPDNLAVLYEGWTPWV